MRSVDELIHGGLKLVDPKRFDLRGELICGKNVNLDINVIIKGRVELGDNVTIEPNCIIEDSVIGSDVHIKENTSISGAKIHSSCRIGPFARLRPGSFIGEGSHIGNFVEIKNCTMGRECKINHHTFLGDATLGDHVIFGAGCIICNYNGSGFEHTHVGSHAFIGSAVQLISPLSV